MTSQPHHDIPAMVPPPNCFSVLVVDDMVPNRMLLRKMLTTAGYFVTEATDGTEALGMLERGEIFPDIVITDIEMPGMNGVALVDSIRHLDSECADVPVIAASGNADASMQKEALGAGSDVFLTKPFDFSRLRKEIASLLKSGRRQTGQRVVATSSSHRHNHSASTAA